VSLSAFGIRNPVPVNLLMVALLVAGLASAWTLRREFFPESDPEAVVVTLANGDLQGYVVTADAVERGYYEAGNAIFKSPEAGEQLVEAASRAISRLGAPS
jgi:hypothetical protein